MPLELLFRLVSFIAFGMAILIAIFYYYYYKKNVKIVEATSQKINRLKELNKTVEFNDVNDRLYFEEILQNNKKFKKQTPKLYLQEILIANLEMYSELIDKIEENKRKNYAYWLEIVALEKQVTCMPQDLVLKKEKYVEIETKIFNKLILKPPLEFKTEVNIEYRSPKGRKHYNKREVFSYSVFKTIFNQSVKNLIEKETKTYHSKVERAKLTPALRYKILCKDNFKCQICGKSAKDGVILHVDHIVPVSKGGRTEIDNLRTLCSKCNLGKGQQFSKSVSINNDVIMVDKLQKLLKNED